MGDSSSFVAHSNTKNQWIHSKNESWISLCSVLSPLCGSKKPKYIEAYAFNDDSDDDMADSAPLMSQDPTQQTPRTRMHLITGYLSLVEVFILVIYAISLAVFSLIWFEDHHSTVIIFDGNKGEKLLAVFCMFHSFLWLTVAIMDRIVQWKHQIMRRKGYLKFYRRTKNLRRIPFVVVSAANAFMLVFLAMVLYNHLLLTDLILYKKLNAFHVMYIIVGLEIILSLPCLLYYIVLATIFNCLRSPPDVIQETTSIATSPTATLTSVGFRDGEELDELLERQADMIRYLQQHNASLGRRIMELQARTVE